MAQPELTYLESFEHPPLTVLGRGRASATGSASSKTVEKTKPPCLLVKVDVRVYLDPAERFLQSGTARQNVRLNEHHIVSDTFSANCTEADAVHLSNDHILQPVMVALRAKYPKSGLLKFSESHAAPLRVDTVIKRAPYGKEHVVMLIEYKRTGYIIPKQFQAAIFQLNGNSDLAEKKKFLMEKYNTQSHFEIGTVRTKACRFVQQVTAYSNKAKCQFVVLCDFENMILLRYLKTGPYEPAEATIVPRQHFRRALLGFAIEAFEAFEAKNL